MHGTPTIPIGRWPPLMTSRLLARFGLHRIPHSVSFAIGVISVAVAAVLLARAIDTGDLITSADAMVGAPLSVLIALVAFGSAFVVRAGLWVRVLPGLAFRHALAGINLALGANHVLPLRLGEPMRIVSVVRRTDTSFEAATASTVALRAADIASVAVIGVVLGPTLFARLIGPWGIAVFAVIVLLGAGAVVWLRRVARRTDSPATAPRAIRLPGPVVALGSMAAWLLEAVLVWQCAHFAGLDVSYTDAILVTTVAVAAQTFAIAPSGLGTYEAASVAAYAALGFDPGPALAAALTAHALKTLYSLVAGGVAVFRPAPSLLGHLRLPSTNAAVIASSTASGAVATPMANAISPASSATIAGSTSTTSTAAAPRTSTAVPSTSPAPSRSTGATTDRDTSLGARADTGTHTDARTHTDTETGTHTGSHTDTETGIDVGPVPPDGTDQRDPDGTPLAPLAALAPIVLFLPSHDEEASVAGVVRRVPAAVLGHPVECLVIDDGSSDATAERATAAGATVVSLGANHGLGAAVRRGLREGSDRGAAAVVFCDADGEYAPEELARMVEPILAGEADYVIGSRFAGTIEHMHPHRRFGNVVLTKALSFVARRRLSDGQSGYRALSSRAAADAEIVHDFNYAQVLTLDLLAKGFRYTEVPITYRFRTEGRSFIRLGRYLRSVTPAVYRELNGAPAVATR